MTCQRCGKCCEGTLMELSFKDLKRLKQAGYRRDEFAEKGQDGIWRLRNLEGHCVLFDQKSRQCSVYLVRPLGCYIYPVNIGPDDVLIVDALCPACDSLTAEEKKRKGALLRSHLREIDAQARLK